MNSLNLLKMEIVILEESKNLLKMEVQGEDHTLANYLRKELWQDKSVKVAGYNIEHPLVSHPVLIVETSSGSPRKALLSAVERLKKKNITLLGKIKNL